MAQKKRTKKLRSELRSKAKQEIKTRILDAAEASEAYRSAMSRAHDIVPLEWTADHVRIRIVEAFQTLRLVPPVRGPSRLRAGGSPRDYTYSLEDKADWEEGAQISSPTLTATSAQLERMESVFDWLLRYLGEIPETYKAVCQYAHAVASNRSIEVLAKKLQTNPYALNGLVNEAVCNICAGLRQDRIAVS